MIRKWLSFRLCFAMVWVFGLVITCTVRADEPAASIDDSIRRLDGQTQSLRPKSGGATVLVFTSSECPISNAYSPTLRQIETQFSERGAQFLNVCIDPDLSDVAVRDHASEFELTMPIVRDRRGTLARRLGVAVTPEVAVIDDQGRLRYRGRIDDQFAARGVRNANPASHDLRDAIAEVLGGVEVARPRVAAVGCPIPDPPLAVKGPTFAEDVALILQNNCQECHRRGQVGPFALETYEQARKRAEDIASVVESRLMPPWKPDPNVGRAFKHSRALSQNEIQTLVAWADAGAPEGDPTKMPPVRTFSDDWNLGTPDLVVEMSEDFEIPAEVFDKEGKPSDIYRCFVIPTNLPNDVYISAIEYRPGNRGIVHHILAYVDTKGEGRKKDTADPGLGYECFSGPGIAIHGDLGGWAPGNEPSRLPEGVGRSLPKGADVVMQVHYHPNGKTERDRTRIGLHFSKKPVKQTLHWSAAADFGLKIPAGAKAHASKGEWKVPVDMVAYAVTPHMHMLGRDIRMFVTMPDGRREDLVGIKDWHFGWQNTYYFEEPLDLPAGSVLRVEAHHDNSAENPRNPNKPPKEITWGEATTDEMMIGFLAVTKKGQDLTRGDKDDLHDIIEQSFEEQNKELREQRKRGPEKVSEKSGNEN